MLVCLLYTRCRLYNRSSNVYYLDEVLYECFFTLCLGVDDSVFTVRLYIAH